MIHNIFGRGDITFSLNKHVNLSFEKDIFRKYPNKYESIIATLCENLDTLDEPEARYSFTIISEQPLFNTKYKLKSQ